MAIERKKQVKTAIQIASDLGRSEAEVSAAMAELNLAGDAAGISYLRQYFEVMPVSTHVEPAPVQIEVPAVSAESAAEKIARSDRVALDAALSAAATMGDSTSNLFQQVESELGKLRSTRDAQLAPQIAKQVFDAENQGLGKSFSALLQHAKTYDPYKGTALEGVTGSSTIDINAMLSLPSGSN